MSKNFWIYAGCLIALLVLAWLRWTGAIGSDESAKADDVIVLRQDRADIEKIAYHDDKLDVVLEQKADSAGEFTWVNLEERKEKPKPKPAGAAEAEDAAEDEIPAALADDAEEPSEVEQAAEAEEPAEEPAEVEITTSAFKGGDAVDKLLDALAPLKAHRDLGPEAQDALADLGLAEPEAWVEITRKGKVRRLELGGEAYGTRDTYLRDTETGGYYLVDADVFRPLRYAKSRLPDRRLSALEQGDIARVVLESPAGRAELLHKNRQDEDAAYWASSQDPEQPVELYANWLDKALRLKGLSYVQEEEKPAGLAPAFALTLAPEVGAPTTIQVFSAPAAGEGQEPEWYASSEFTRGLMKLHKMLASEAAEDVPDVLDAEPGEALEE
ncbi:MAG: DUF4340 domain-containing protein [Pseudomonadota bacterium]